MRLKRAILEELELPLVEPFTTSFGTERRRRFLLLEVESREGEIGIAECVAAREPLYSSESVGTAREILTQHLLPALLASPVEPPDRARPTFEGVRGNPMAKATVEMAMWDLRSRRRGRSLAGSLGGRRASLEVGVSVGIQGSVPALVRRVGRYLQQGYRRVKIKVRPGWDRIPLRALRREFPDVRLWVDANQAYRPRDLPRIAAWATDLEVEQVEQPFAEQAWTAHARLARAGGFRVCLDESVVDRPSLELGLQLRAVQSLNVKPGRVGGHGPSLELARVAAGAGAPAWVGGMLETGVGRAHNLALASVASFTLPGDISASDRYYGEELVTEPFTLDTRGRLRVPRGPGLGVEIDERVRRRHRRWRREIRPG